MARNAKRITHNAPEQQGRQLYLLTYYYVFTQQKGLDYCRLHLGSDRPRAGNKQYSYRFNRDIAGSVLAEKRRTGNALPREFGIVPVDKNREAA
jgi:hypothetical protein